MSYNSTTESLLPTTAQLQSNYKIQMKSKVLSIRVDHNLHTKASEICSQRSIKLAEFIRQAINKACHTNNYSQPGETTTDDYDPTTSDYKTSYASHPTPDDMEWYKNQITVKDEQIKKLQQAAEGLQQALDQSQQLHAMSEQRHESELTKIEGRSLFQRLKAALTANP